MNLLFITNTIQTMSGASKIIRFVAEHMAKVFDDVSILAILDSKQENKVAGCKVHCLGCKDSKRGIWRISARAKIRNFVKEHKPDIVCAFVSDACFMTRWATLRLPIKLVTCDRGDPQSDGWMWSRLSGWAYRNSNACVFQLKQVKDYFGEKTLPPSYVIPNPFVPVDIEQTAFGCRQKTIVSSGRFTEQKGFDILIQAFKLVHNVHPEYRLIIYGDGPLRETYQQLAKELSISEFVDLPGFVDNVPEKIRDAGVFCLSSRYEGIPNALLEAMSLGLTTVATNCTPGGADFLTDGGQRGLLVPKDDVNALAEALLRCIEDKQLAQCLSDKAVEICSLFSPQTIASQWEAVFKTFNK